MADTTTYLSGGRIQGRSDDTLDTPATTTTDGSDTILTFTESGTFTPAGSFNVEYIVVGGGGSGGTANATANSEAGGGGGAGGYQANGTQDHAVTAQTYTITVGTGGASQASAVTAGSNGTSSIFSSITSIGGGAGGSGTNGAGASGGSGGGSGAGTSAQAGGGSSSNGNNGGAGTNQARGGGGGGAGAVGVSGSTVASGRGSNGGAGVANDITGSSLYYAGGGGSGAYDSTDGIGSLGGSSVGGNGGGGEPSDPSAQAGTANTGSGGGGTGRAYLPSGAGATGVVIIRFTTSGNSYTSSVGVGVDKSKTSITNVPVGTRYEETDTRKIFRRKDGVSTVGLGSAADGTTSGATLVTGHKLGTGCLNFDGSNDYVSLGTNSGLNLLNGGTVACWVNTDNITNLRFLAKGSNGAWELLSEDVNNTLKFRVNDGTVKNAVGDIVLSDSTWYHVAGVYDKSAGEIRLYVNGVLDETTTGVGQIATITTAAYIGRNEGGNYYDGRIDDVGIWNTILPIGTDSSTAGSIKYLYNGGTGRLCSTIPTGLLAYYSCDSTTTTNIATKPDWVEKGTA